MTKLLKNIKLISVEDIIPYHNNPKEHPEEQVAKIASSIKNYGFTVPLVIDGDNEIIAGHGRYSAAKKLGLSELPCIKRDDLNDAQVRALRLADNRVAESEWNLEQLAVELENLDLENYDLEMTGFDGEEIGDILDKGKDEVKEDDFDLNKALEEAEDNIISREGDLWLLGRHRLYCGDSLKEESYHKLFNGDLADLIVTDPPYNVNYGDKAAMLDEYQKGHRNTDSIKNDNMGDKDFAAFLYKAYKLMYENIKEGGSIYVFHADTEGINFRTQFKEAGFKLAQCLIWVKNVLVLGRQDYQWKHEPILYGWKEGAAHHWNGGRKQTTVLEEAPGVVVTKRESDYRLTFDLGINTVIIDVPDYDLILAGDDVNKSTWFYDKPLKNEQHPTMKPVVMLGRALKNSSRRDEIVLDPFGGSGSTLIAAEQTARKCYMIEMDPKYTDVIIKRYQDFKNNDSDVFLLKDGEKVLYKKVIDERAV